MARTPPPRPPRKAPPTRTRPDRGESLPPRTRPPVRRRRKIAIVAGATAIVLFAALVGVAYTVTRIPLPQQVGLAQSTIISYSDGNQMARIGTVNRTDVSLSDVPIDVQHDVLAAEDRNYYSEPGISVRGILRALVSDVTAGGIKEGGSTITQQYVKNAYLTQSRTFSRKLKEIVMAVKLDHKYKKNQVLEWYLNTIYFGRGAYGIEAATQAYFGGHAKDLSLAQGAVLAGLIRSPGYLDPRRDETAARARFKQVLDTMVKQKWMTQQQEDATKFPFVRQLGSGVAGGAGLRPDIAYLRQQVENELIAHGVSEDKITSGDLRITTTIDRRAQQAAETAVESVTAGTPAALQEGLIAIDPATGAIRASYGGKEFDSKDYLDNVFDAKVPPGSSFKPIVLTTALSQGISLRARYDGHSPKVIPGTTYTASSPLKNFSNEQFGKIDLTTALANSVNTVFVPLGIDAGLTNVVDMAHKLGIPSQGSSKVYSPVDLQPQASIALGVNDVAPVDMGAVYATFAAQGVYHEPYLVSKVTDRHGNVIYEHSDNSSIAADKNVVADATTAMQAVVQRGTGTAAALTARPAAGKTGTTSDNRSAWFCGFTPQLAAAVTLFYDDNKPLRNIGGFAEVTGGTIPAIIWKKFMDAALQGQPVLPFPAGANVGAVPSPSPGASVAPTPTTAVHEAPTPTPSSSTITLLPPPASPRPSPQPSPSRAHHAQQFQRRMAR